MMLVLPGNRIIPVVGHVHDVFLRSDGNLLQNFYAGMLADVVAYHDTVSLAVVSAMNLVSTRVNMPQDE